MEGDRYEVDEDVVMKALDAARSALAKDPHDSFDDFRAIVLGGPALMATKGMAYHDVCGVTTSGLATDFCKRRGVQYTFRASYNAYGDRVCGVLARSCATRCNTITFWS